MPASRHFETDVAHTARACLLLAVRPFAEGSEWAGLEHAAATVAVPVADVLKIAEAAGGPMGPKRLGAALAELERLSEETVLDELGGKDEDDEEEPLLRPVRRARRSSARMVTIARLAVADEELEDELEALAMRWEDVLSAANLDDVETELEEIIPALFGGAPAAGRPLPASAVPGNRRTARSTAREEALEALEDAGELRDCPACGESFPAAHFRAEKGTTRYGKCRTCRRAYFKAWKADNPEAVKKYAREKAYAYEPRPRRGRSFDRF